MILNNKQTIDYINQLNQEHEERRKQIYTFALNCSEYINLSEVFSLPYKDRILLIKLIEKRVKEINAMNKNK